MKDAAEDDDWCSTTSFGDAYEEQFNTRTKEYRHRAFARASFFANLLPDTSEEKWIDGPAPTTKHGRK